MDIIDFYKYNIVPEDFDDIFYAIKYPETVNFYQPFCKNSGIGDRERLYFHYFQHGKNLNLKKNKKETKIIYLKPSQGIGNRILLIDSVYAFAELHEFDEIKLCWCASEGFSEEKFEDLFDLSVIPNIFSFIEEKEYKELSADFINLERNFYQDSETLDYIFSTNKESLLADISKSTFFYNHWASLDWLFKINLPKRNFLIKNHIKPSQPLKQKIDALGLNHNAIGIHIRRGDAVISPWAKYYEESKEEIFHNIAKNSKSKIFLSTDSEQIQEQFVDKYKEKIIFNKEKEFVSKNTTISDYKGYQNHAIVDLFCLSQTRKIYGTNWSTFSLLANNIGSNSIEIIKADSPKYDYIPSLSAIVGIKNRCRVLKTSIHSWLLKKEIKEIIIVNASSSDEFDAKYFESLDSRIKVLHIDTEYFNLSEVYNFAVQNCSYDNIIKLDVDYLLSPYFDLLDWLNLNWESDFLTGDWRSEKLDNRLGFLSYLNGFLCVKKQNLIKAGLYQGNKYGYGYDDCDLYNRLEKLGLKRRIVDFSLNNIPIIHIPHTDYYRTENYEEKDLKKSFQKNYDEKNSNIIQQQS